MYIFFETAGNFLSTLHENFVVLVQSQMALAGAGRPSAEDLLLCPF